MLTGYKTLLDESKYYEFSDLYLPIIFYIRLYIKINMATIDQIGVFVNLLVALGTILLAIISYKNIEILKKQTKLIFNQSNFLRLQQTPLLKIDDLKLNGNEIILGITNIGNGIAKEIGVRSMFFIVNRDFVEPPGEKIKEIQLRKQGISKNDWEATTKLFGKEMWFKHNLNLDKELFIKRDDGKRTSSKEIYKANPTTYIRYLKEEQNSSPILGVGENGVFKCVPEFWTKAVEPLTFGRGFSYDDLLNLCKENGIEFLGFKFDLVYKDLAEDIQMPEELITCAVDINSHKTIEEAVKQNHHLDFFPLGQFEVEKKLGGKLGDSYECVHSPNYFDEKF